MIAHQDLPRRETGTEGPGQPGEALDTGTSPSRGDSRDGGSVIARLRELHEAVTPGLWEVDGGGVFTADWVAEVATVWALTDESCGTREDDARQNATAALIAEMRNRLPALLDCADALERMPHASWCGVVIAPSELACHCPKTALARLEGVDR